MLDLRLIWEYAKPNVITLIILVLERLCAIEPKPCEGRMATVRALENLTEEWRVNEKLGLDESSDRYFRRNVRCVVEIG